MPRRPKPTALRALDGNAGHRPANGREPSVEITLPDPPDYLDDRARAEWERVGRQLFLAKVITALDRANFAAYCSAVSRHERAEVEMRAAEKAMYRGKEKARGRAVYRFNIAAGQRRTALAEVHRLGTEFGLTPASRAKIRVPDGQADLPFAIVDGGLNAPLDPLAQARAALASS